MVSSDKRKGEPNRSNNRHRARINEGSSSGGSGNNAEGDLAVVYLLGHGIIDPSMPDANLERRAPKGASMLLMSPVGCKISTSRLSVENQVRKVVNHVVHGPHNKEYKHSVRVNPGQLYANTLLTLKNNQLETLRQSMLSQSMVLAQFRTKRDAFANRLRQPEQFNQEKLALFRKKLHELETHMIPRMIAHIRDVKAPAYLRDHPNVYSQFRNDGVHVFKLSGNTGKLHRVYDRVDFVDPSAPGMPVRLSTVIDTYMQMRLAPNTLFVVDTCREVSGNLFPDRIVRDTKGKGLLTTPKKIRSKSSSSNDSSDSSLPMHVVWLASSEIEQNQALRRIERDLNKIQNDMQTLTVQ